MDQDPPKPSLTKLNDELLKPSSTPTEEPKRNSKEFLIERIVSVAEENNLELNISNTKLKRMSKPRLQKMLGEMIEDVVKTEMAAQVNASSTDDGVIALATLRMMHDLLANGVERGLNVFLPRYGYEVEGFSQALKEPMTSQCVDDCLKEIAAENEVLQYVKSPFARLGIAWSSGLIRALRRAPNKVNPKLNKQFNNAAFMGSGQNPAENTFRFRPGGRSASGKVDSRRRSSEPNVKQV